MQLDYWLINRPRILITNGKDSIANPSRKISQRQMPTRLLTTFFRSTVTTIARREGFVYERRVNNRLSRTQVH